MAPTGPGVGPFSTPEITNSTVVAAARSVLSTSVTWFPMTPTDAMARVEEVTLAPARL